MEKIIIESNTTIWDILTAIGTVGAVIVALFKESLFNWYKWYFTKIKLEKFGNTQLNYEGRSLDKTSEFDINSIHFHLQVNNKSKSNINNCSLIITDVFNTTNNNCTNYGIPKPLFIAPHYLDLYKSDFTNYQVFDFIKLVDKTNKTGKTWLYLKLSNYIPKNSGYVKGFRFKKNENYIIKLEIHADGIKCQHYQINLIWNGEFSNDALTFEIIDLNIDKEFNINEYLFKECYDKL